MPDKKKVTKKSPTKPSATTKKAAPRGRAPTRRSQDGAGIITRIRGASPFKAINRAFSPKRRQRTSKQSLLKNRVSATTKRTTTRKPSKPDLLDMHSPWGNVLSPRRNKSSSRKTNLLTAADWSNVYAVPKSRAKTSRSGPLLSSVSRAVTVKKPFNFLDLFKKKQKKVTDYFLRPNPTYKRTHRSKTNDLLGLSRHRDPFK